MLGRLAKWLRILGYDTYYNRNYTENSIKKLLKTENRLLLSRSTRTLQRHETGFLIHSEHLQEQLKQLVEAGLLKPDPKRCFQRCLVCNKSLDDVEIESARDKIPEYIFYQHVSILRKCPSCDRYYWQGSHRGRMMQQLEKWGILNR
jgi:uncharacterized protein with PIN domain